ncbi:MAG: outer membrane protein assembly factor BamD [Rhabdaerophilum sp.]
MAQGSDSLTKTRRAGLGLRLLAGAMLAFTVSACETVTDTIASINPWEDRGPKSDIGKDERAEVLFNDGLARLEARDFGGASKKFVELDKQYPYSNWSRRAMVLSTFASYEGGDFADAINHGRRYVQLYPASPDTPYVQYLVGMSYHNQILDITRDQERAEKSLVAFEDLVRKWPNSEYAGDARDRIRVARDQLAGKEMDIGRFYLNQRNYTGSINRFREVVIKYQNTRHIEEALSRLVEAYMAMGIVNEAQTAAAVLGHNFPDSQWYKDAFTLLKSGGLEPRENRGSWISRAFQGATRMVGL